ncbi:MAG: hypothetical protein ACFFF9_04080 [Candidatus Thorarchaeota archaeon]
MSEEDTYVRAKLTEINGAIERLTQMLNRMIEVISAITDVQENTSELTIAVNANTERLDEMMEIIKSKGGVLAATAAPAASLSDRGAVSSLQAVLDTLETQVREGVIASDLAQKISESAGILEGAGVASSLIVKMQRWTRILRTYGRVDTISPSDLSKLRGDIKEWSKELAKMR